MSQTFFYHKFCLPECTNMSNLMRLLVFFDIPVDTKKSRGEASRFRNYLIKDGFYMIQFSVYGRLCNTLENAQQHEKNLKYHLPYGGSVRSMIITEKQYSSMNILCGEAHKKDKHVSENQISFF